MPWARRTAISRVRSVTPRVRVFTIPTAPMITASRASASNRPSSRSSDRASCSARASAVRASPASEAAVWATNPAYASSPICGCGTMAHSAARSAPNTVRASARLIEQRPVAGPPGERVGHDPGHRHLGRGPARHRDLDHVSHREPGPVGDRLRHEHRSPAAQRLEGRGPVAIDHDQRPGVLPHRWIDPRHARLAAGVAHGRPPPRTRAPGWRPGCRWWRRSAAGGRRWARAPAAGWRGRRARWTGPIGRPCRAPRRRSCPASPPRPAQWSARPRSARSGPGRGPGWRGPGARWRRRSARTARPRSDPAAPGRTRWPPRRRPAGPPPGAWPAAAASRARAGTGGIPRSPPPARQARSSAVGSTDRDRTERPWRSASSGQTRAASAAGAHAASERHSHAQEQGQPQDGRVQGDIGHQRRPRAGDDRDEDRADRPAPTAAPAASRPDRWPGPGARPAREPGGRWSQPLAADRSRGSAPTGSWPACWRPGTRRRRARPGPAGTRCRQSPTAPGRRPPRHRPPSRPRTARP